MQLNIPNRITAKEASEPSPENSVKGGAEHFLKVCYSQIRIAAEFGESEVGIPFETTMWSFWKLFNDVAAFEEAIGILEEDGYEMKLYHECGKLHILIRWDGNDAICR